MSVSSYDRHLSSNIVQSARRYQCHGFCSCKLLICSKNQDVESVNTQARTHVTKLCPSMCQTFVNMQSHLPGKGQLKASAQTARASKTGPCVFICWAFVIFACTFHDRHMCIFFFVFVPGGVGVLICIVCQSRAMMHASMSRRFVMFQLHEQIYMSARMSVQMQSTFSRTCFHAGTRKTLPISTLKAGSVAQ